MGTVVEFPNEQPNRSEPAKVIGVFVSVTGSEDVTARPYPYEKPNRVILAIGTQLDVALDRTAALSLWNDLGQVLTDTAPEIG